MKAIQYFLWPWRQQKCHLITLTDKGIPSTNLCTSANTASNARRGLVFRAPSGCVRSTETFGSFYWFSGHPPLWQMCFIDLKHRLFRFLFRAEGCPAGEDNKSLDVALSMLAAWVRVVSVEHLQLYTQLPVKAPSLCSCLLSSNPCLLCHCIFHTPPGPCRKTTPCLSVWKQANNSEAFPLWLF